MDMRQLKYFITIAEEGQITNAAKRLHMAQPPLSRQLKEMEEEIGMPLFERYKKKRLILTPEGEVFLNKARDISSKMDESILEMQELNNTGTGVLSIGSTIYSASFMLNKIKEMQDTYPDLTLKIWEGEPAKLYELLDHRQIEIAVTTSPIHTEGFESKQLRKDPLVVVVSEGWLQNNYSSDADSQQLLSEHKWDVRTLAEQPLILLRTFQGNGIYDDIMEHFEFLNVTPNIVCECHDSAMLMNLVSSDFGVTILPRSMLSLSSLSNLRIMGILDNPLLLEPAVVWRKNGYLSKTARAFLNLF